MENVVLSEEQLTDIREKYDPAPGSQLDKALETAEEKQRKLDELIEKQAQYRAMGARADGFMAALLNYRIDLTQDGLLEQVKEAQSMQEVAAALDAPFRTMVQQTRDDYSTASGRVNNIAKFLADAARSRQPGKLPWALAKYCGKEAPPAGLLDRAKQRVRSAAV